MSQPHAESAESADFAESTDNSETNSAGADSPHLDHAEREQVAEHSTPAPLEVHEVVREEGETAMDRTFAALMWSALAAGLSMGFSFLVQSILESALPETSWCGLVSSFGYTIGFVFVILGRQ